MYNIHAMREQWDYFTIASKLQRVIDLFRLENGYLPTEIDLSEATGLSRGQIRRCRLLLDLPDRFQDMLLVELGLPKSQQKLSEDFFIEMEKSLKAITKRIPEYGGRLDEIRDVLVQKFRGGQIPAVTDFRQLSKIATAVDSLGIAQRIAKRSLDRVFDAQDEAGIREAYKSTVEFEYDEKKAARQIDSLTEFIDDLLQAGQEEQLDEDFLEKLKELYDRLRRLFGDIGVGGDRA
jgi:ParB family transcriptional regulator, chromosome partitioning protein